MRGNKKFYKTHGFPTPSHDGFGFMEKRISTPTEQRNSLRNKVCTFRRISPWHNLQLEAKSLINIFNTWNDIKNYLYVKRNRLL